MEPIDGPLNNPSINAQTTAMLGITFCQDRFDALLPQHLARTFAGAPSFAADWRNRLDQGQQLRNVVSVRTGHRGRQRNAARVGNQMMLAARFPAIRGIWPCFFPPCTARTEEESTIARDQSIWSACCKLASSTSWIFFHTPAFCQACKRRQAVIPEPQPNSCGRCSHGRPVLSTNRIAHSAWRLPSGLRPGYRRRRRFGRGKSDSTISHNSLSRIGLAITAPPCAEMELKPHLTFSSIIF